MTRREVKSNKTTGPLPKTQKSMDSRANTSLQTHRYPRRNRWALPKTAQSDLNSCQAVHKALTIRNKKSILLKSPTLHRTLLHLGLACKTHLQEYPIIRTNNHLRSIRRVINNKFPLSKPLFLCSYQSLFLHPQWLRLFSSQIALLPFILPKGRGSSTREEAPCRSNLTEAETRIATTVANNGMEGLLLQEILTRHHLAATVAMFTCSRWTLVKACKSNNSN